MSNARTVHGESSSNSSGILSGHDIICFALRAWGSPWKNNQQLMSRLAASNRVLYVNPPRSIRAALSSWRFSTNGQGRAPDDASGLHLWQEPLLLPRWGRSHVAARLFNAAVKPMRLTSIQRAAKHLGFRNPILWIYDPLASNALGHFRERLIVYYVIDNYNEYFAPSDGFWRTMLIRNHREMLERADVVFAVSESLHLNCLQVNPNSFLVPNGVDVELFQAATLERPSDLATIPSPVIAYVGIIAAVIDLGLLEYVATQRPQWSIMLVGPVMGLPEEDRKRLARLVGLPNVYHIGFQPPHRLPAFIGRCDVALMPYRVGPLTQHGDSLKLYEYLACGKPVVSTNIPSARRFQGLIKVVQNHGDFLLAIERSLGEEPERANERRREAERHSWTRRVEALSAIVKVQLDDVPRSAEFRRNRERERGATPN